VQGGAAGTTFIMPSAEAWAQFEADAEKQRVNMTDAKLDALFSYLITRVPIAAQKMQQGVSVPMNLAADKKALASLCPKSAMKGQLVFATDTSAQLAATSDTAVAARTPAPQFGAQPAAGAMGGRPMAGAGMGGAGAGMGAAAGMGGSQTLGAAPAGGMGGGMGMGGSQTLGAGPAGGMGARPQQTLGAGPAMGGPSMGGGMGGGMGGQPTMGVAPARPAGGEAAIPGLGPLRRLMQALGGDLSDSNKRMAQVEEPAPSEEDPTAFSDLLLPTTYQAKVDTVGGGGPGIAAATGKEGQDTLAGYVAVLDAPCITPCCVEPAMRNTRRIVT
jgi:hypothetical protein